jgi:hypothetical protein
MHFMPGPASQRLAGHDPARPREPSRFEVMIDRMTAKAPGLASAQSTLACADKIIE